MHVNGMSSQLLLQRAGSKSSRATRCSCVRAHKALVAVLEPTGTAAKTGLVTLDNWSSLHAVITNNEAYP